MNENTKQSSSLKNIANGVKIKSITPIGKHRVVNLTVEKNHTFVTANGICVHNCDRLSSNAADALKDITESFSSDVRFIMTCNNPKRLPPALLSRFESGRIDMSEMNKDGIVDLCLDIVEAEGIEVTDPDHFMSHIDAYAPDIRRVINSIDKNTINGILTPVVDIVNGGDINDWISHWDAEHTDDWDWKQLLELTEGIDLSNADEYFEVMYNNLQHFDNVGMAIVRIAEYVYRISFVANHRMLIEACLYAIFEVDRE